MNASSELAATEIVLLDWEFTDLGPIVETCPPLSMAVVPVGEGDALYLEFAEDGPCHAIVQEHVLPLLTELIQVEALGTARQRLEAACRRRVHFQC